MENNNQEKNSNDLKKNIYTQSLTLEPYGDDVRFFEIGETENTHKRRKKISIELKRKADF